MTVAEPARHQPTQPDPGWQRWLDLVELAVAEAGQPAWAERIVLRERGTLDAPLLHDATVRADRSRTSAFVRRIAREVGVLTIGEVDPLSILLAGIERDDETIATLAERLAVEADTVAVVVQLAALPVLLNASRTIPTEASRAWQRGYCLLCGAWPALVEMRGIQRERRLRCGCCAADWALPVLRCAFCDETDHKKLGFLMNEGADQQIRVETCATCRGYLKSVMTLGALPFPRLAATDLSSVAYDLAARERGYTRPSRAGWTITVALQ